MFPKSELIDHCAFRKDLPSAIVYDWTRLYRKGISRWGLSIPFNQLETLPDEDLEVEIITEESPSEMHVYDYLLKGQLDDEIIINAHNCHPFKLTMIFLAVPLESIFFSSYFREKD